MFECFSSIHSVISSDCVLLGADDSNVLCIAEGGVLLRANDGVIDGKMWSLSLAFSCLINIVLSRILLT